MSFGPVFSVQLQGQIYAQPLVSNGTLLIVTEDNQVYGLDPDNGAVRWARDFGTPFDAADLDCGDLSPHIGITSTPVVDESSNVMYVVSKRYESGESGDAIWEMQGLDVTSGESVSGFPVVIAGTADNDPDQVFTPTTLLQRPGLLLLDGVVYAAFGAICDHSPWTGWVAGVATSGTLASLWAAESGEDKTDGGGIWQSGGGLVSDGPGTILFATGNGGSAEGCVDGSAPPATLGEAIVRLHVQPDNSLQPIDFFMPYDATELDDWDGDLGSGAPVALPSAYFGTPDHPNLVVHIGKQGYLYLLDGDDLGGIGNADDGGDAVLQRLGPYGGVWGQAAAWPGEGGFVYLATASGGGISSGTSGSLLAFARGLDESGTPALSMVGQSMDSFGFGSSSPVITSNGSDAGSALVWIVWSPDHTGVGAQLRAYDPNPVQGILVPRFSAPIGTATKFALPGIGDGKIYVGTSTGEVRAFGEVAVPPLRGKVDPFGSVRVGDSQTEHLTLTAAADTQITEVTASDPQFTVDVQQLGLPMTLESGSALQIPVQFTAASVGLVATTVDVTTERGIVSIAVSAEGAPQTGRLVATPPIISFGSTAVGSSITDTVRLTNTGGNILTIDQIDAPTAPFSVNGEPRPSTQLEPSESLTLEVNFVPTQSGMFADHLVVSSDGGMIEIALSGVSGAGGHLQFTPTYVRYGAVAVGCSRTLDFVLHNSGGTPVTIFKSKPPSGGAFAALSQLLEGSSIAPGASVREQVRFTPTAAGYDTSTWTINGNDGTGLHNVTFQGHGLLRYASEASHVDLLQRLVLSSLPLPKPSVVVPATCPTQ